MHSQACKHTCAVESQEAARRAVVHGPVRPPACALDNTHLTPRTSALCTWPARKRRLQEAVAWPPLHASWGVLRLYVRVHGSSGSTMPLKAVPPTQNKGSLTTHSLSWAGMRETCLLVCKESRCLFSAERQARCEATGHRHKHLTTMHSYGQPATRPGNAQNQRQAHRQALPQAACARWHARQRPQAPPVAT